MLNSNASATGEPNRDLYILLACVENQTLTTNGDHMCLRCLPAVASICLIALLGCGSEEGPEQVDLSPTQEVEMVPSIQYLQGTSETTSPDGSVTYETVDVLARRTIDSVAGTIVEDTVHGDEVRRTFFTLQTGTSIFDVTDEENSFSGTVAFEADDWVRSNVTYDLEVFGDYPGTITGTGMWAADTYSTDKEFADPMGAIQARIFEVLTVISEEEYAAALPE